MPLPLDRRVFMKTAIASAGALCLPGSRASAADSDRPSYRGPNVIIIRFGGGVRRLETIDPDHTHAPFFRHELTRRATLFTDMSISESILAADNRRVPLNTSHGEGTLNILTGIYANYKDIEGQFLGTRFEAIVPTLFEYLRKAHDIPRHQALIVNGEDRTQEEFYSFSNHHLFGVHYRSSVLSLYRFKCHLLRRQIRDGDFTDEQRRQKTKELRQLESLDYRESDARGQGPEIEAFWGRWQSHYGESGLVNPRGDRLLTELAVRAIRQLRPRLMMVNYNDPDYVHWGNINHYTRGIAVIDRGIQRLVETCDADERYRDNTVFVIVPDCGRDSNRYVNVPCQHHFNSKSSRQISAMLLGPGITKNQLVDKPVEQISIAPTISRIMGLRATHAEGAVLEETFA